MHQTGQTSCKYSRVGYDIHIMWKKILAITLAVTPILFLPLTQDYYDTAKWMILVIVSLLTLIFMGISLLRPPHPTHFSVTRTSIAFGALALASVISLFAASSNKVEALVHPLGLVTFIAIAIITSRVLAPHIKPTIIYVLYGSAAVLGLFAVYQFLGMGGSMFPGVAFLSNPLWTPTGAATTTIAVFAITLALLIPNIARTAKKSINQGNALPFLVLAACVLVAGGGITVWQLVPKISTGFLPYSTGWTILIEVARTIRSALVGVGVENFLTAYVSGKPIALQATPLWNIRFSVSSNFFFHIGAVYGLVGVAASIFLARFLIFPIHKAHLAARITTLICLLLLPPSLTILAVTAIVSLLSEEKYLLSIKLPTATPVRYAIAIIASAGSIALLYPLTMFYGAELAYFQALSAAGRNEGTNSYNLHIRAIKKNPYISRYHTTFSQVSLAIANTIAAGATKTVSESDQKLTSELIQQAISESKVAVTLSPQSITAWENLGNTYQAIMTVATGSDAWAETSYTKALSLDPTNPVLWVNLGGVLVHEKKLDDAITAFNRAIFLRSSYANAYYNLANAYRLKGDTVKGADAATRAMNLVEPNSSDYFKAKNELDSIQNATPVPPDTTATASSQFTLPQ